MANTRRKIWETLITPTGNRRRRFGRRVDLSGAVFTLIILIKSWLLICHLNNYCWKINFNSIIYSQALMKSAQNSKLHCARPLWKPVIADMERIVIMLKVKRKNESHFLQWSDIRHRYANGELNSLFEIIIQ